MLRTAIPGLLQNGSDNRMTGRLASEMVKVIQADTGYLSALTYSVLFGIVNLYVTFAWS
jgi:hypothetical protein